MKKQQRLKGLSILILAILFSCARNTNFTESLVPPKPINYAAPKQLSLVTDERINEASGLACSRQTPRAFWTHNDSGDGPNLFLINMDGKTLTSRSIAGANARDWEDIASFKLKNQAYILIADVGDNKRKRQECQLYLIKEPPFDPTKRKSNPLKLEKTLHFQYEDSARNCESIGVDVTAGKIYLVSKQRGDECKVYEMPLSLKTAEERLTAKAIAILNIPTTVAMDISPDGQRAVILTRNEAYEYTRFSDESRVEGFAHKPKLLNKPKMKQGEAICYGPDGQTLYLVSEGVSQPMWEVPVVMDRK